MKAIDIKNISLLEDRLRKLSADFSQSREFARLHTKFKPNDKPYFCTEGGLEEEVEVAFNPKDPKTFSFDPNSIPLDYFYDSFIQKITNLNTDLVRNEDGTLFLDVSKYNPRDLQRVISQIRNQNNIDVNDIYSFIDPDKVPPIKLKKGTKVPSDEQGDYVSLDLKDFLIIGAMTNSGMLFTGKSGAGKTHLAKMAMTAFFGSDRYCNKTVTPGMTEEAFIDYDFGKMKEGSTLKEAISSTPMLTNPGIILNEVNRAPSLIQNVLIPYLEREFNIKGLDLPVGVEQASKDRYQFRILSVNEGTEYRGTSEIDKAVRDRSPIEIPIDQFKSLKQDIRDMIKKRKSSSIAVDDAKESLEQVVFNLFNNVSDVPLSAMASEFLVYLSGLSNCIKSSTGSKEGIAFTLDTCKGCKHAAYKNNVCGNIYAPTNRSLLNLQAVAKGVASVRAYKVLAKQLDTAPSDSKKLKVLNEFMTSEYLSNLEVSCEDVLAIAPFILYSKIQINDQWVRKNYQGNKFKAIQDVVYTAYDKFTKFYREHKKNIVGYLAGGNQETNSDFIKKYALEKDPWMANIKDFENKGESYSEETGKLIASFGEQ
jgi:MoxR-like ATPase